MVRLIVEVFTLFSFLCSSSATLKLPMKYSKRNTNSKKADTIEEEEEIKPRKFLLLEPCKPC